jgi:hypothetical protein
MHRHGWYCCAARRLHHATGGCMHARCMPLPPSCCINLHQPPKCITHMHGQLRRLAGCSMAAAQPCVLVHCSHHHHCAAPVKRTAPSSAAHHVVDESRVMRKAPGGVVPEHMHHAIVLYRERLRAAACLLCQLAQRGAAALGDVRELHHAAVRRRALMQQLQLQQDHGGGALAGRSPEGAAR